MPGNLDWDIAKLASARHVSACAFSRHHVSGRPFDIPYRRMMLLTTLSDFRTGVNHYGHKEHA